MNERGEVGTR